MKEKSRQDDQLSYKDLAQQALGDSLQYTMNSDSSMVLCQRVRQTSEPPYIRQVHYCVVELGSNEIIHQANMANGKVTWHHKNQLRIQKFKAYPTLDDKGGYIYDLKSQSKVTDQNKETTEE